MALMRRLEGSGDGTHETVKGIGWWHLLDGWRDWVMALMRRLKGLGDGTCETVGGIGWWHSWDGWKDRVMTLMRRLKDWVMALVRSLEGSGDGTYDTFKGIGWWHLWDGWRDRVTALSLMNSKEYWTISIYISLYLSWCILYIYRYRHIYVHMCRYIYVNECIYVYIYFCRCPCNPRRRVSDSRKRRWSFSGIVSQLCRLSPFRLCGRHWRTAKFWLFIPTKSGLVCLKNLF